MIVCVLLPHLPLRVALRTARRPLDAVAVLGPSPGEPQVVGLPTDAAAEHGIRPGLRVGEALARCPELQIIPPDPAGVAAEHARLLARLEAMGAAVEPGPDGVAFFRADGLKRLYGGLPGVVSRARGALTVGLDGRVGAASTRFCALHAARQATTRAPRVVHPDEVEGFLAPLPIESLPLDPRTADELRGLGLLTVGDLAALSHRHALERLGFAQVHAWHAARGVDDRPLRPRPPANELRAHMGFADPVGSLPTLQAAARLLLGDLAAATRARGTSLRSLVIRVTCEDDGSWSHTVTLREPTCDADGMATAALHLLERVTAPATAIEVSGDASGPASHGQLSVLHLGASERALRMHQAAGQVRTRMGDHTLMRAVELEPWSRLPEHRWALVPFDTSPHRTPSA